MLRHVKSGINIRFSKKSEILKNQEIFSGFRKKILDFTCIEIYSKRTDITHAGTER
jgi:hypothetical protein